MAFLSRLLSRKLPPPVPPRAPEGGAVASTIAKDPWFWAHYESAACILLSEVSLDRFAKGRTVLDFGCGDGAMALGVASRSESQVHGVDLYESFNALPGLCRKNLGRDALPTNLALHRVDAGQALPFDDGFFDLTYSWSVFEHLSDPEWVLSELHRITAPGGLLFIQIEPLFHGPFGSHLRRLVDVPWAHLLEDDETYLRRVASASDQVPENERDVLYRTHEFEELKRHLIAEYRKLNRITADELAAKVAASGFRVASTKLIREENLVPDERLLERYPRDLLLTNQIVLVAERTSDPLQGPPRSSL
jgi:ubiquinone/menaquinone biosynthesis C-methylase UbiE